MINYENANSTRSGSISTNDIFRDGDIDRSLTSDLNTIESNIAALQTGKADINHTHANYLSEDDAVSVFASANHTHPDLSTLIEALDNDKADANHTHSQYAASTHTHDDKADVNHTHSDINTAIETLNTGKADVNHTHSDISTAIETLNTGKANSTHTHAQSEITGLEAKLTEIDTAIAALEESGSSTEVQPMLIASMHLGKLDNNSGAEFTSSTRICSDAFAIQNGKSYWQVNDKAVNMYVLIYDADEVFLSYLGNFASGAEIAVNNADAAYMRIGSTLGEYDLTNVFRIYDVDPATGGSGTAIDAYTKAESDARFAPISHAHSNYATTDHTHSDYATTDHTHTELHTHANKTVLDGITAAKVAAWDAGTGSTTPTIDAYTKTESDARFAPISHTHADYMTESDAEDAFAPITHTHSNYMTSVEAGNAFAPITHEHAGYAAENHTHSYNDLTDIPSDQGSTYTHPATHPASMITGLATVATSGKYSDLTGKPTSLPANGGDADTVGGKYPSSFANVSHTHSTYLPLSGGSLTGNLNVGGIFRVNNQQSVYDDGSMITLSTNNRQTMIAGSKIYSKQTIQVSSDERLKENIEAVDSNECIRFINDLDVKTFNYIGDDTPCMGIIAQDLQDSEFEKFFVSAQSGEEGYLTVKAADLVFPLIATVQKLSAEIDYLKTKV